MTERLEKLRHTLEELESELRDLDSLDEASRAMLAEVSGEINAVLSKNRAPETASPHTLSERLLEGVESFEAAHPTLAGIVRRLVDGLAQMGI